MHNSQKSNCDDINAFSSTGSKYGHSHRALSNGGCFTLIVILLLLAMGVLSSIGSGTSSNNSNNSTLPSNYAISTYAAEIPTWDFSTFPTIDLSFLETIPVESPTTSSSSDIIFIYYPKTVRRNEEATVKIKGTPNTKYSITVMYSSGPSTADGLESKYSDNSGYVTWYWHVGGKTNPGTFKITVCGGGNTKSVNFYVSD